MEGVGLAAGPPTCAWPELVGDVDPGPWLGWLAVDRTSGIGEGLPGRASGTGCQLVGDRQLTYFGESFGTLIGQTYANLFPRRVRAMALDGVVDAVTAAAGTEAVAASGLADTDRNGSRTPLPPVALGGGTADLLPAGHQFRLVPRNPILRMSDQTDAQRAGSRLRETL